MPDDAPASSKPPCDREDALAVLRRLREAGHVAYFAGGCVRDLLLGLEPKDWDIATDAQPPRVRQLFSSTQAVGVAFGVILVRHRRSVVEVATFRTEGRYLDGRRPSEVHFTDAEHDARRRDFTINGLFLDPIEDRVIDHVGGQEDLRRRQVRAIGDPDERFEEDHLRLLRAVRFASRFEFEIEERTAAAIRTHAPRLKRISPERVAEELRLMLTPPTRGTAWVLLWEHALIDVIFRFLPSAEHVPFEPERSLFLKLAPQRQISFGDALAAGALCYRMQGGGADRDLLRLLSRDEVLSMVRAMRQALRISNDESEEMRQTLLGGAMLLGDEGERVATQKRFLARPTWEQSLAQLDALAGLGMQRERIESRRQHLMELRQTEYAPPPLITGDDLANAGMRPGPVFRQILDAVYDAQLEGKLATKEQAMEMARRVASGPPA
jgi:poly(A) polymerase